MLSTEEILRAERLSEAQATSFPSIIPGEMQNHWVGALFNKATQQHRYLRLVSLTFFLTHYEGRVTPAPVDQGRFRAWKTAVPEREVLHYFQPVSMGDSCQALSHLITVLLLQPLQNMGENEDGYHIPHAMIAAHPEHLRKTPRQHHRRTETHYITLCANALPSHYTKPYTFSF